MSNHNLFGQTALITGGVGDIGLAMAVAMASAGADVILWDVVPPREAQVRLAGVKSLGSALVYQQVDVSDRDAVEQAVASAEFTNPLSIVCVNAGIVASAPFLEITEDQWLRHLNVNLTGSFNTAQITARHMVEGKQSGRIVFTSSWVAEIPWPEIAAYAVSKAGVNMLMRQMARELAPHGIRVNAVAPGIVNAGLAGRQLEQEPRYAERVAKVIPLGAPGTPEDVASAVLYLASAESQYMTGAVLTIDGGCSLFQFDKK